MKIKIEVTQDDIDKGIPESGCSCPIVLALKRYLPALPALHVSTRHLCPLGLPANLLVPEPGRPALPLPAEAQAFIKAFDSDVPEPDPIEFVLDVPAVLVPGGAS